MGSNTTDKKILVTVVAGFIGYHLSKRLLESGYEVFGIDLMNSYYQVQIKFDRIDLLKRYKSFSFSTVNICKPTDIGSLFAANRYDIVMHLAVQAGVRYSLDHPHKYTESNLVEFVNKLEACRKFEIKKLVHASSSSVYGNITEEPFSENNSTDEPVSLYAATKKANEILAYSCAKQFGIQTVELRFFSVYGPWGRPDMAYFSFTNKILNYESIPVFNNGEMVRDFTYIDGYYRRSSQLN